MTHTNTKARTWLDNMGLQHPLVIAGPCSAETEEQLLTIAHGLKKTKTTILRAGLWKPRTRPGNFEGVGALGLPWLKRAKEETGLLTTTEVAHPHHVELALQHDVDILWIGARTTVSPFIVQDLADALQGTDKIVLVKNPVNPDLALWMGAIERFEKSGISQLGAIHRGFSSYEKHKYRNTPEWQIAIDFQSRCADVPLIVDPSHMGGRRDLIFDLSQTALDLNYDGLMIESHHQPDLAWSDAAQQVTPGALHEIITALRIRKPQGDAQEFQIQLDALRTQIDLSDRQIIETLGRRMKIASQIGQLKQDNNVAILQSDRWYAILEQMIHEGTQLGLSEEFVQKLFKAIHQESINQQKSIGLQK
ncbi:MAG: bifunctional 3-deoxy-7-phosphoheptulonate synthase/chorismate mutase type II [Flavobacteriaceae bacterium]|jgi:chorismate mutase|nr:bifunctional 3-deoxy-7-phosphoheptulonate synthase/chorismate mutase type II [Flavobacteriaceae bacterium]MDG1063771.1 bifunctional 3-deoxy-7-phosphoheptulonate synthase/chorismate mutase type II [Flavobacteriaceae bacterium]MDG1962169.1 bifunctional 3-deoxy-7-phosphoheptulonate synthase/chorismate mutase type II [Flavobacteriaceae bacterium]